MTDNQRGILAMLAATFAFTVGDAIMKTLGATVPVGQSLFLRGLFAIALLLIAILATGAHRRWRPALLRPTVWRSLAEVVSTAFFFVGLTTVAFAEASAIGQMAPLLVTAGAALFLGEQVGIRRWTATVIGFLGVLLIVRPGGDGFSWGAIWIFVSTMGVACRDLITRRMPADAPTLVLALGAGLAVTLTGLAMKLGETWVTPTLREWSLLATSACTVICGYVAIIGASRIGDMSVVSPFRYAAILFGVIIGVSVFNERLTWSTYVGIALILAAGLYTLWREHVRRQESLNALRFPVSAAQSTELR
jgi:drug/metabolite transporter (DMT)-like permease